MFPTILRPISGLVTIRTGDRSTVFCHGNTHVSMLICDITYSLLRHPYLLCYYCEPTPWNIHADIVFGEESQYFRSAPVFSGYRLRAQESFFFYLMPS